MRRGMKTKYINSNGYVLYTTSDLAKVLGEVSHKDGRRFYAPQRVSLHGRTVDEAYSLLTLKLCLRFLQGTTLQGDLL